MKKYKDFDAQFAEMKKETVPFRIFGKLYEIPKAIPAALVLEMTHREETDNLSTQFMLKAADMIFGKDTMREICEHPEFSVTMLGDMIRWAFETINGKADEENMVELSEDDMNTPKRKN